MFAVGKKVVVRNGDTTKAGLNSLGWNRDGEVVGHGVVRDRDGVRSVYLVELDQGVCSVDEEGYISTIVCDPSVVFEA